MLKIYYAETGAIDDSVPCEDFSSCRLDKLKSIKVRQKRQQGIGAELLLIHAIRENCPDAVLPLNIKLNRYGKPFCDELPFFFSLSHSGNLAACGISDTELGLDIQAQAEYNERLSKRQFSVSEQGFISASADADTAFTRIWSMKESYIKAIGTGLHTPMNSFSIMPEEAPEGYTLWCEFIEKYCFSVCRAGEYELPEIIKLKI